MAKGTTSKTLLKGIQLVKKSFVLLYKTKAGELPVLCNLFSGIISLCDYVLVRKRGNIFVEMEISSICNSRCIFCSYTSFSKNNKIRTLMSEETYEKVLEKLRQVKYDIISFTPTTGDTLVNPDWDKYIQKTFSLDSVKTIIFYTNGILMNSLNIEKLIQLIRSDKQRKLFSLLFSLGGYDRETYLYMFGVDKFDLVRDNLRLLLTRLQQEKMSILVQLEFRIPRDYNLNLHSIKKDLNRPNYPFLGVRILRDFSKIQKVPLDSGLSYLEDTADKKRVCSYLFKTRFAADGGVWADGCVISEFPGDTSLKLGTVDDDWNTLEQKRKKIVDNWEKKGIIPEPCKECSMYRSYKNPFPKGGVIPVWKKLYSGRATSQKTK